jgi:hypothetical protein
MLSQSSTSKRRSKMTTVPRKVIGCVQLWDVLDHIGFSDQEVEAIADYGISGVSFGDATYTLIGNNYALHLIQDSIAIYYDERTAIYGSIDLPHIYTAEEIAEKFWAVVNEDDYINLESH